MLLNAGGAAIQEHMLVNEILLEFGFDEFVLQVFKCNIVCTSKINRKQNKRGKKHDLIIYSK